MAAAKPASAPAPVVFDRAHLEHSTMQDQRLAAEVLELFLAQLPITLQRLEEAATEAEWRFATHTLKGSSAAVGAEKLRELAMELEVAGFPGENTTRRLRLQAVKGAAAIFRDAVRGTYPDGSPS